MSPEKKKKYAIIIITVFCLIIVVGIGNFRAKQLAVNLTGERVTNAVGLAVTGLNTAELQELIKTHDEKAPYYEELRSRLVQVRNDHELANIYMLYKDEKSKEWFYIADARTGDDPEHMTLGQPETSASSAIENTLKGKVVQGEYHTTSVGATVSSYQLIKNTEGETVAVMAGDITAASLTDFIFLTRYIQMGIIAVGLVLIGCIVYIGRKKSL